MPELPEPPGAARPGDAGPARPFDVSPAAIGMTLAIVGGAALLGLAAGYAWWLLAPRALLVIVSHGAAGLVQSETSAFIAADGAYCLIALAGGAVCGALGYLLGVRRYGPLPMIGVLAGALVAGFLARWAGEQPGSGMFHHLLATLPVGARLHDSLTLGASGAIAFWPLAAGLVAGGLEAFATRDQRRRRGAVGTARLAGPGGGQAWSPGPPAGQPWQAPGIPGGQPRLD
jgi:hypothetical protein